MGHIVQVRYMGTAHTGSMEREKKHTSKCIDEFFSSINLKVCEEDWRVTNSLKEPYIPVVHNYRDHQCADPYFSHKTLHDIKSGMSSTV